MEDHFTRLPDDIVVHIFDAISDAKWLCRCSVVSGRFASLIPRVNTVTIASTSWNSSSCSNSDPSNENKEPQGNDVPEKFAAGNFESFNQVICSVYPFLKFLAKLKEIRSLHIELPSDSHLIGDELLIKWGAKFGTKLLSITFLQPKSIRRIIDYEEGQQEDEEEREDDLGSASPQLFVSMYCLRDVVRREAILMHVVLEHPMLRDVAITDQNKRAVKLFLRGEKLAQFKNSMDLATQTSPVKRDRQFRRVKLRECCVPVLRLPLPGYVMEGAMLCAIKVFAADDDCDSDDDEGAILVAFEEEDGVFREAVVEILANHKNSFKTIF